MLKSFGYSVVPATDCLAALELFRARSAEFDLVITDQIMPQLPGSELIGELLTIRPDMKVILCTGYSSIMMNRDTSLELGFKGFLLKPLNREKLALEVRSVLDGDTEGGGTE